MRRCNALVAMLALTLSVSACGKYGPPVRALPQKPSEASEPEPYQPQVPQEEIPEPAEYQPQVPQEEIPKPAEFDQGEADEEDAR